MRLMSGSELCGTHSPRDMRRKQFVFTSSSELSSAHLTVKANGKHELPVASSGVFEFHLSYKNCEILEKYPLSSPPPSSVLSFPLLSFPLLFSSLIKICLNCIYYYQCVNIFCTVHLTLSQSLLPHSQMKIRFYKYVSHFFSMYNIYKSLHLRHMPLSTYFVWSWQFSQFIFTSLA